MAWRSSGATNEALIANLSRNGLVSSARVRGAMVDVDRAHFAPSSPYQDSPQRLPHTSGATISAPHMHALAAESLLPFLNPGATVLDVGSGSGYLTLLLAELVQPGGRVVGIEHVAALAELGERNVAKSARGRELLADRRVRFVKGDGRRGWIDGEVEASGELRYDAIHVGAAAKEVHAELLAQLQAPGRIFMPVEDADTREQHIYVIDKKADGSVSKERKMGVRYVPLTDAPGE